MPTASIRLDQDLVDKAAIMAKALNRTTPKQIAYFGLSGHLFRFHPARRFGVIRPA